MMDEWTTTADYYNNDGSTAGTLADALAASGNAAQVPSSSWADGLKSVFGDVKSVVDFGIGAAKAIGTSASNAAAQVATNNNRNQAAIVESKRAVSAAQAAPMSFQVGGVDLRPYIVPMLLIVGAALLLKVAK